MSDCEVGPLVEPEAVLPEPVLETPEPELDTLDMGGTEDGEGDGEEVDGSIEGEADGVGGGGEGPVEDVGVGASDVKLVCSETSVLEGLLLEEELAFVEEFAKDGADVEAGLRELNAVLYKTDG